MILNYFHNLIASWFPTSTSHYIMHVVVMAILALIIFYIFKSEFITMHIITFCCTFIELDQLITNTGVCDTLDIVAGMCGALFILIVNEYISFLIAKFIYLR